MTTARSVRPFAKGVTRHVCIYAAHGVRRRVCIGATIRPKASSLPHASLNSLAEDSTPAPNVPTSAHYSWQPCRVHGCIYHRVSDCMCTSVQQYHRVDVITSTYSTGSTRIRATPIMPRHDDGKEEGAGLPSFLSTTGKGTDTSIEGKTKVPTIHPSAYVPVHSD